MTTLHLQAPEQAWRAHCWENLDATMFAYPTKASDIGYML